MEAIDVTKTRWSVEGLRDKIYDCDYELRVLDRLNLDALDSLLQPCSAERIHYRTAVAGNFADQIIKLWKKDVNFEPMIPASLETLLSYGKQLTVKLFYPDSFPESLEPTDDIIILNPALAESMLLNDRLLRSLSRKTKSRLIFFLDTAFSSDIGVVWRKGFSSLEQAGSHYFRWYDGQADDIGVDLVNALEFPVNCIIKFMISSPDPNAEITFCCSGEPVKACPKTGVEQVDIRATLVPGHNKLTISYSGKLIQTTSQARALKFIVIDLTIWLLGQSGEMTCVSEDSAYHIIDDGENPIVLGDSQVRKVLHQNGFFEVDTFLCYAKESPLQRLATSRYHHIKFNFYYLNEPIKSNDAGLKIYVAKRKGQIQ